MSKNSRTWNDEGLEGDVKAGVPGAAPRPVTVKRRTCEKAESIEPTAPPPICVALTRQKYVPAGRPLTSSCVGVGMVSEIMFWKPCAATVPKVDVVPTCHR